MNKQKIIFSALLLVHSVHGLYFEKLDETAKSMIANDEIEHLKTYCGYFNQHDLLLHACSKQAYRCADILLKDNNTCTNGDGFEIERNPLYVALIHNNLDFADFLIIKGADVNTKTLCSGESFRSQGKHPGCQSLLHHFIVDESSTKNILAIQWLIKNGADQSSFGHREDEINVKATRKELKKMVKIKIA